MRHTDAVKTCWLKVSVNAAPALADALSDFMMGVTGAGVEIIVDDNLAHTKINAFLEKRNPEEAETKEIVAQITEYAAELSDIFQVPLPEVSYSVIEDQDWGTVWKEHFKPFAIIPGLVIKPTWEDYRPSAGEQVIEMDPGMAFGTGHHATTSLSLALLQAVLAEAKSASVLDVGTGTGILGMAAALFGAERVVALDNDPDATAAAAENVVRNGLGEKMSVSLTPLADLPGPFFLVVANIVHDVLLELADDLERLTAAGGRLILSGVLTGMQSDSIIGNFSARGFTLIRHLQQKEWSALLLEKPQPGENSAKTVQSAV
jgi:ribosomal protein L11 methyltransferase